MDKNLFYALFSLKSWNRSFQRQNSCNSTSNLNTRKKSMPLGKNLLCPCCNFTLTSLTLTLSFFFATVFTIGVKNDPTCPQTPPIQNFFCRPLPLNIRVPPKIQSTPSRYIVPPPSRYGGGEIFGVHRVKKLGSILTPSVNTE